MAFVNDKKDFGSTVLRANFMTGYDIQFFSRRSMARPLKSSFRPSK